MFKGLILIVIFSTTVQFCLGQNFSWSEPVNLKGKAKMRRFLSADSSGFTAVVAQYRTFGNPEAFVEEFSLPEMESVNSYTARTTTGEIETLVELGGKIYALVVTNDAQNDRILAHARLASNPASKMNTIGSINYKRVNQKGSFDFVESVDREKLLVVETPAYEKYKMEEFKFIMFDSSFTILWEKEIKLPYLDQEFKIVKNKVDENGNVFLLTAYKSLVSKQSQMRGMPIKNYTVLIYNKEQNRLKEFNIRLKDKWVSGLNMEFDRSGDLVVGGFYNVSRDNGVAGTFYLTIDKDSLTINSKSLSPFSDAFLSGFPLSKKERIENQLEDYYFDHFVIAKDGSAFFTAEQYYVRTTSYFDQRTGVTNYTYYYHYNDIIVVKMDAEAKILWTRRVPKKQVTTNDNGDYSGYAVVTHEGGLKVLFNDNPKNLEDPNALKPKPMNNPQRSRTVLVSISPRGEIQKSLLFSGEELETIIQPRIQRRVGNDALLLFTQKSRSFRFVKMSFSE